MKNFYSIYQRIKCLVLIKNTLQILAYHTLQRIAKLHLEEGRTLTSLAKEYNIAKSTLTGWIKCFSEECIESKDKIPPNIYEEIKLLKKRVSELEYVKGTPHKVFKKPLK